MHPEINSVLTKQMAFHLVVYSYASKTNLLSLHLPHNNTQRTSILYITQTHKQYNQNIYNY